MTDATAKVALVTGASRGIGRSTAVRLAGDGFIVVGTATSQAGADAISERLTALGNPGCGLPMRVEEDHSVKAALATIGERYTSPAVLVNNAGITRDNLLLRMQPEQWDEVIDTNLGALYRVSKACLRGMTRARWGRIVNISSVVGAMGNPGQSNYAASKAGIEGFSRALAHELGSRSITVNCVAPGFIDTDMTRALAETQRQPLLQNIPLGRFGDADEVAALVSFLVSDDAGYITGQTIHVNGGMFMN